MAFENWSQKNTDVARLKRLVLGGGLSAAAMAGVMVYLVVTSKVLADEPEEEDKVVEVQLAKEPELEPEPPPPPPPAELKPQRANPGPRLQKLEVPTTISDDKLQEKEAKPATEGGDPYEKGGGDGTSGPKEAVVEAPVAPPPPPPPKIVKDKPRPVSETDTPPELLGTAVIPEMPAEAKAAGIEGTVIVKYTVTETGVVTDVRVLKGPPELHAVCLAAVKSMRFKPGRNADGVAQSFTRTKSFRFKLRT